MLFIIISLMLCVSVDMHGLFDTDINHAKDAFGEVVENALDKGNNHLEERIDQVKNHAKELQDQTFDNVGLVQAVARVDAEQLIDHGIVNLTQNITKAVIASSFGVGAVIGLYQAAKVAITLAYTKDEQPDKQEYVTMFSGAGVAALCATCSLLCYWSIS